MGFSQVRFSLEKELCWLTICLINYCGLQCWYQARHTFGSWQHVWFLEIHEAVSRGPNQIVLNLGSGRNIGHQCLGPIPGSSKQWNLRAASTKAKSRLPMSTSKLYLKHLSNDLHCLCHKTQVETRMVTKLRLSDTLVIIIKYGWMCICSGTNKFISVSVRKNI